MNGKTIKNRIRKGLSLAFALVLCLTCCCLANAGAALGESSGTVKIEGSKSSWRAYQLVAGEVSEGRLSSCSTKGLMNERFWKDAGIKGTGQDVAEELAAIAGDDSDGSATARLGRIAISSHAPAIDVSKKEAKGGFSLAEGYWLLTSDLSQPMLVLVGSEELEITAKSAGPTIEKQVRDASGRWREARDAGQGQMLSFRIVCTVPSNAAAYKELSYKIVDELPTGMWVDAESVRVVTRDAKGNKKDVTESCSITVSKGKLKVDVGKGNALSVLPAPAGKARVTVLYKAKLTEQSASGAQTGNPNLAHLVYTGSPTDGKKTSTEKAMAQVYTWKIRLVKTGSGHELEGAVFELRNAEGGSVGKVTTGKDGTATFPSVGSGTYRLVEVEAPEGFKRANDTTISLKADIGTKGAKTRISAHAEGAGSLQSATMAEGIVTIGVVDAPGSDTFQTGTESESEGIFGVPQTGDVAGLAPAALAALALACCALLICRKRAAAGKPEKQIEVQKGRR